MSIVMSIITLSAAGPPHEPGANRAALLLPSNTPRATAVREPTRSATLETFRYGHARCSTAAAPTATRTTMIHGASCDWTRLRVSHGPASAPAESNVTKGRKVPQDITATATRTAPAGRTSSSLRRRDTSASSTSSGAQRFRGQAVTRLLDGPWHLSISPARRVSAGVPAALSGQPALCPQAPGWVAPGRPWRQAGPRIRSRPSARASRRRHAATDTCSRARAARGSPHGDR
jgi:hypothetical protein